VLPGLLVAVAILGGQVVTGIRGLEHGWPFACYPTFQHDPGPRVPILLTEEESVDGTRQELPRAFLGGMTGQREWGGMWSVLRQPTPERLLAWWRFHRDGTRPAPGRVRFYFATVAAAPEGWAEPPRRESLLADLETEH
jgi:hypothetical protein